MNICLLEYPKVAPFYEHRVLWAQQMGCSTAKSHKVAVNPSVKGLSNSAGELPLVKFPELTGCDSGALREKAYKVLRIGVV